MLADGRRRIEILYSDMQLDIRDGDVELFGNAVHPGFAGNVFSREHLEEYLPRIAASAAGGRAASAGAQ